ncbi:MAG: DNA gyrase/topoisomerase IV subunit A, partial [Dokdonia donghaensis]|nr:DNA gyrase/topoisomerase IV subunit A [Dokdonia donghaensis]
YGKRFLIDSPDKEETFISDHSNSQLELVSTDWRPVAEMVFYKQRGKDQRENETVSMEDFIAIKGISAMGNTFFTEKLKGLNWIDSLPYEEVQEVPKTEIEVVDEKVVSPSGDPTAQGTKPSDDENGDDGEGQTTLF